MFLWECVGDRWVAKRMRVFCDSGKDWRPTSWQKLVYILKNALYFELVDGAMECRISF